MKLGQNFGKVDDSPKGRATVKTMIAALGIPLALGGCSDPFEDFGTKPRPSISKGEPRAEVPFELTVEQLALYDRYADRIGDYQHYKGLPKEYVFTRAMGLLMAHGIKEEHAVIWILPRMGIGLTAEESTFYKENEVAFTRMIMKTGAQMSIDSLLGGY